MLIIELNELNAWNFAWDNECSVTVSTFLTISFKNQLYFRMLSKLQITLNTSFQIFSYLDFGVRKWLQSVFQGGFSCFWLGSHEESKVLSKKAVFTIRNLPFQHEYLKSLHSMKMLFKWSEHFLPLHISLWPNFNITMTLSDFTSITALHATNYVTLANTCKTSRLLVVFLVLFHIFPYLSHCRAIKL